MKNILINDFDDKFDPNNKKFCSKGYNLHTVMDYETEIPGSLNEHNIKCHFISMKDAVRLRNLNKYANKVDTSFIIKHEEFLLICLQDLIQMKFIFKKIKDKIYKIN